MTNKFLLNRSGMSPEVTCRKDRHAIEPIVSRFSLASLICLCMLTIGVGQMWGAEVTLTFTTDAGRAAFTPDLPTPSKANSSSALTTGSPYTQSNISITVATGSSPTTPAIFWKDKTDVSDGNTDLRIYREAKSGSGLSGNTLTISSTYTITALTINGSSLTGLTTPTGTSGGTGTAKTWSGSATSITYTNTSTNNIPITSIVVTYTTGSCSDPAAPSTSNSSIL